MISALLPCTSCAASQGLSGVPARPSAHHPAPALPAPGDAEGEQDVGAGGADGGELVMPQGAPC